MGFDDLHRRFELLLGVVTVKIALDHGRRNFDDSDACWTKLFAQ